MKVYDLLKIIVHSRNLILFSLISTFSTSLKADATAPSCELSQSQAIESCQNRGFYTRAKTILEKKAAAEQDKNKNLWHVESHDDYFSVAYLGIEPRPRLCCDVKKDLSPTATPNLWTLSLAGKQLSELSINLNLILSNRLTMIGNWQGKNAKPLLVQCKQEAKKIAYKGPSYSSSRDIYLFVPESIDPMKAEIIYLADGPLVDVVDQYLPCHDADNNRSLILVGLPTKNDHDPKAKYTRSAEYLYEPGKNNPGYDAHNKWFIKGVIPWLENTVLKEYQITKRHIGGFSSGAAWALSTSIQAPDKFDSVLLASPIYRTLIEIVNDTKQPIPLKVKMSHGFLELNEFLRISDQLACALDGKTSQLNASRMASGHSRHNLTKLLIEFIERKTVYSIAQKTRCE